MFIKYAPTSRRFSCPPSWKQQSGSQKSTIRCPIKTVMTAGDPRGVKQHNGKSETNKDHQLCPVGRSNRRKSVRSGSS